MMSEWYAMEDGATIGLRGAEGGAIMADEEHPAGARITLERDCLRVPYAITVGVYGWLVHTRFIADEPTAVHEYGQMKAALENEVLSLIPESGSPDDDPPNFDAVSDAFDGFVERYA